MPQPNNFDPFPSRLIAHRPCPACGSPMFLSLIEPTYQKGYEVRTFECLSCAYAEMALIDFDQEMVASKWAGSQ